MLWVWGLQAGVAQQQHTIVCTQGSYTLTGQAVTLTYGHKLTCAQGSYTLSGQAVTLTRSSDALGTVYGAALTHEWFQDYNSGTGVWGDDIGSTDVSQSTANRRPTSTTTPATFTALSFDVTGGQQDALASATHAAFPASIKSGQYGFAVYAPSSTGGASFASIFDAASLVQFYWSLGSYQVSCFGSSSGDLTSYLTAGAWNRVIIDVRGGADAATNGFNVYINRTKVYSHSGATIQDPTTEYAAGEDDFTFGGTGNDLTFKLCSPFASLQNKRLHARHHRAERR